MKTQIVLNLAKLDAGNAGTIRALHFEPALAARLAALGFRIGKRIEVIRRGRFSGPLHVRIGSTDVMLRRREARQIDVAIPA